MKVSVICPFFNEATIIENVIHRFERALATLDCEWELILVNDGSLDDSVSLAHQAVKDPRFKITGYEGNRGRGYALRYGASLATGDILVTTEIDLSWGDDIVHRFIEGFAQHPEADMIIASPHLPGGGYQNVPVHRIWLSTLGNKIFRMGQDKRLTMFTGMTRAYRREVFQSLPLDEDGKEFHLEVVQKARAFGYWIYEIPCQLKWPSAEVSKLRSVKHRSAGRIRKLMFTHLIYALSAAPFRYVIPVSILLSTTAASFLVWSFVNLSRGKPSIFIFLASLLLFLFAFVIFSNGVLSYQIRQLQRDIWRIRRLPIGEK